MEILICCCVLQVTFTLATVNQISCRHTKYKHQLWCHRNQKFGRVLKLLCWFCIFTVFLSFSIIIIVDLIWLMIIIKYLFFLLPKVKIATTKLYNISFFEMYHKFIIMLTIISKFFFIHFEHRKSKEKGWQISMFLFWMN